MQPAGQTASVSVRVVLDDDGMLVGVIVWGPRGINKDFASPEAAFRFLAGEFEAVRDEDQEIEALASLNVAQLRGYRIKPSAELAGGVIALSPGPDQPVTFYAFNEEGMMTAADHDLARLASRLRKPAIPGSGRN